MPPPTPSTAPARIAVGAPSQSTRPFFDLESIKNRSYFFIDFPSHLGSIFGSIWEPFGTLFGIKIGPSSVQDAFSSSIFFKNVIFTKTYKNQ